jgi:hypothetical protein
MRFMHTCFVAFISIIFAQTPARGATTVLSEPVIFPFNIFCVPQHASFELKVAKRSKYNAIIKLEAPQKNSSSLMEFAKHLSTTGGDQRLLLRAHIKMTRIDNREVVMDYTTDAEELYGSSPTQLSFRIQSVILEKGEYDVVVETLAASAPIDGVTSSFILFVRKL